MSDSESQLPNCADCGESMSVGNGVWYHPFAALKPAEDRKVTPTVSTVSDVDNGGIPLHRTCFEKMFGL
jgi:hypothetical protein